MIEEAIYDVDLHLEVLAWVILEVLQRASRHPTLRLDPADRRAVDPCCFRWGCFGSWMDDWKRNDLV